MEMETVVMDNLTKGEEVQDKEEGTKHRALRDTLGQGGSSGGAAVGEDELCPVC